MTRSAGNLRQAFEREWDLKRGLFSHRARVRVRIPFPSKFESVSSKPLIPESRNAPRPHAWALREHCVTTARATGRRLSLNMSNAMLSMLSLSCVGQKLKLDIRIKHLNELTRIALSAVLRNRIVQLAPVGGQSVAYERFKTMDNAKLSPQKVVIDANKTWAFTPRRFVGWQNWYLRGMVVPNLDRSDRINLFFKVLLPTPCAPVRYKRK